MKTVLKAAVCISGIGLIIWCMKQILEKTFWDSDFERDGI